MLTNQKVWCLRIADMKYSKLVNKSLTNVFCGYPFIDVKSSLLIFISNTLNKKYKKN